MKQLESGLVSKRLSKNESTLLTQIQELIVLNALFIDVAKGNRVVSILQPFGEVISSPFVHCHMAMEGQGALISPKFRKKPDKKTSQTSNLSLGRLCLQSKSRFLYSNKKILLRLLHLN